MHLLNSNLYDPEPSDVVRGVFGCGAHVDYGALSVLHVDGGLAGLQLCLEDEDTPAEGRTWVDAAPPPGTLVVNMGEMMRRWSNNRFKAALHRVVTPEEQAGTKGRLSMVLFFEPSLGAPVGPLPCAVPAGEAPAFKTTTFGDFLTWKFSVTGEHKDGAEYTEFEG